MATLNRYGQTMDFGDRRIHSILVITLSNLGDIILTTPVIASLRTHFPSARVSVVVGPKGAPLFTNSTTIDQVVVFNKRASWASKAKFIAGLRKRRFDLVVDLRNTLIPWFIRARYRTPLWTDRSSLRMRDRHLDRLKSFVPVGGKENQFDFFSEEEQAAGLQKLRQTLPELRENNFVVVVPGAGSELKRWTSCGFQKLIHYFHETGRSVVLVGDESERFLGLAIERSSARPVANLMGMLTLREAAGLIGRAVLVVANDSAIMHLAHELGRPTVSIFGPTDEKKYGREGSQYRSVRLNLDCTPCEKAECQIAYRACLDDLPVSAVIQACEEVLNHVSV